MKSLILLIGLLVAYSENRSQPYYFNAFSDGYQQFLVNVYKELRESQDGNFLVSPLSVDTVLALAYNGAKGETATQISSALHLPEDNEIIQRMFVELVPKLQAGKDYELTRANKIYVQQDFKINDNFKNVAVSAFQSEIENIDFKAKTEAASSINQWVKEKTHGKIEDLLKADDFNDDTRLVLLNALYFHGEWVSPFNEKHTSKNTFHAINKKETQVDMMELTHRFNFYECPDVKAKFLEMPYKGKDITMTFVLPNEVDGLADLEEKIAHIVETPHYEIQNVYVQIPKFKVESKTNFNDILKKLGVEKAFSDNADFTGIGAGGEPLKISNVVQKAFIEVEEKGTTAAAVTAVTIENTRSSHVLLPPVEFIADHPFIYYLKSPAGILFVGRYVDA